jgi:hypothetical protein
MQLIFGCACWALWVLLYTARIGPTFEWVPPPYRGSHLSRKCHVCLPHSLPKMCTTARPTQRKWWRPPALDHCEPTWATATLVSSD